LTVEN